MRDHNKENNYGKTTKIVNTFLVYQSISSHAKKNTDGLTGCNKRLATRASWFTGIPYVF